MDDHNSKKDSRSPANFPVFDHQNGYENRRLTSELGSHRTGNGLAGLDDAEEFGRLGHLATINPDNAADDPPVVDDDADELKVKQAEIERLARLSPLRRALQEKASAELIGIPVTMLRKLVSLEVNNATREAGGGQQIKLDEPEPWPEEVDGAALLDAVTAAIQSYVVLTLPQARAVALWLAFAHAFEVAEVAPKLLITSKTKRSGKTRLVEVISYLGTRVLMTSRISGSALYRVIEAFRPMLLIDETDAFLRDDEGARGILNGGFDREGAWVVVSVPVGDRWEPRKYSTWAPQVLAGIGGLHDTVMDRCIRIAMQRKPKATEIRKLRRRWGDSRQELRDLARKFARWTTDRLGEIAAVRPELPSVLDDRAADAWEPLVAIADVAGGAWPLYAREAARLLSGAAEEETPAVILLADLRELFDPLPTANNPNAKPVDRLFSAEILAALIEREDRPWAAYGHARKPITTYWIGRQLKGFGIPASELFRCGDRVGRGYWREWFDDAFARYLPYR